MAYEETYIEGRNAVIEAFRSGKTIDKLYILDGCQDGPMATIRREAKKHGSMIKFVGKERLDQLSQTGKHQGVIAVCANGVAVVNIDNGYGAGYMATQINRLAEK